MYNILLCDDEEDILYTLKIYLQNPEYAFYEAHDGEEAVNIARKNNIDLFILDIMMPRKDGIEAMREIRTFCNAPIILLTAKSENEDKIFGFAEGADDYITKPFDSNDVKARAAAAIRRYTFFGSRPRNNDSMRIGSIELDVASRTCYVNGEIVSLTHSEMEILKTLMANPGVCFAPSDLYSRIWNEKAVGSEKTISVHIRHLREKVEIDPNNPRYLKNIWGRGYCITEMGSVCKAEI